MNSDTQTATMGPEQRLVNSPRFSDDGGALDTIRVVTGRKWRFRRDVAFDREGGD